VDDFNWTLDARGLFEAVAAGHVSRRLDGFDWRAAPGGGDSLTGRKCRRKLQPLADAGFVELPGGDGWRTWETTPAGVASHAKAVAASTTPTVTVRIDAGVIR